MNDLVKVVVGRRFAVWMTPSVAKVFEEVDAKERARCLRWMTFFADEGGDYLDDKKFKSEGKFSTGEKNGSKVAVFAFKAWQLRVYGSLVGRNFIATEIDPAKKQDKADQDMLGRAAKKLAPYLGSETKK